MYRNLVSDFLKCPLAPKSQIYKSGWISVVGRVFAGDVIIVESRILLADLSHRKFFMYRIISQCLRIYIYIYITGEADLGTLSYSRLAAFREPP